MCIRDRDYRKDRKMFRDDPIVDSALVFEPTATPAAVAVLEEVD